MQFSSVRKLLRILPGKSYSWNGHHDSYFSGQLAGHYCKLLQSDFKELQIEAIAQNFELETENSLPLES